MNSFKLLQLEEEKKFDAEKSRIIRARLYKMMESYRFMGQVAEVFTSGFFNAIQMMFDDDTTTAENINKAAVELTLEDRLVNITEKEIEQLILNIRKHFRLNERVFNTSFEHPLLSLSFVMPDEKAQELVTRMQEGELEDLGIVSAKMKAFITLESTIASVEKAIIEQINSLRGQISDLLDHNRVLEAIDEFAPHLRPNSGIHDQLVFLRARYNEVIEEQESAPSETEDAIGRIAHEVRSLLRTIGETDIR